MCEIISADDVAIHFYVVVKHEDLGDHWVDVIDERLAHARKELVKEVQKYREGV